MTEFDKDIEEVKELINLSIKQGFYGYFYNSETVKPFRKYARTYFSTNENINGYLKFISNDNYNNALTVLASGDHLFNLINKGFTKEENLFKRPESSAIFMIPDHKTIKGNISHSNLIPSRPPFRI